MAFFVKCPKASFQLNQLKGQDIEYSPTLEIRVIKLSSTVRMTSIYSVSWKPLVGTSLHKTVIKSPQQTLLSKETSTDYLPCAAGAHRPLFRRRAKGNSVVYGQCLYHWGPSQENQWLTEASYRRLVQPGEPTATSPSPQLWEHASTHAPTDRQATLRAGPDRWLRH